MRSAPYSHLWTGYSCRVKYTINKQPQYLLIFTADVSSSLLHKFKTFHLYFYGTDRHNDLKCQVQSEANNWFINFFIFFFWFINLFVVTLTMNGKFCWIVWIPAKVTRYRFPNKNGKLLFISPHVLLQTNKMALLTALSRFIGQKYKYLQFAG